MPTELLYLFDAELRSCTANVIDVEDDRIVLDRTVFYPTGGGQPHDTGVIEWTGGSTTVAEVRKEGERVLHRVDGAVPPVGTSVQCTIDWERRFALMRTHTALHVLCGVIWNEYRTAVTGGNMEPLSARMDFEFDPLPAGFGETIERAVNDELAAARTVRVDFLPRETAVMDEDLIRTKVRAG